MKLHSLLPIVCFVVIMASPSASRAVVPTAQGKEEVVRFEQIPYKPYPLIDTGLVQYSPSTKLGLTGYLIGTWLDNSRVLINASKQDQSVNGPHEDFDVVLYDTTTRTSKIVVWNGFLKMPGGFFLHTTALYGSIVGNNKEHYWVKFDETGQATRLPFKPAFGPNTCFSFSGAEQSLAIKVIRCLRSEDGFIRRGESAGNDPTRSSFRRGTLVKPSGETRELSIDANQIQNSSGPDYLPWLQRYYVHASSPAPIEGKVPAVLLLSPDGNISEVPQPPFISAIWGPQASVDLVPLPSGLLFSAIRPGDSETYRPYSDFYLVKNGQPVRIWQSVRDSYSIGHAYSPDGCKVAFKQHPHPKPSGPRFVSGPVLILDLCVGERQ